MCNSQQPKSRLRQTLRKRRRELSASTRETAAKAIANRLGTLPELSGKARIATYIAADGEIDPGPAANLLRKRGHALYLPVIQADNTLLFAPWDESDTLIPNRYGIPEPASKSGLGGASEVDAVLLPLVGWDQAGRRLGMGGGYYDRALAEAQHVLKVGLAYAVQEQPAILAEPWDIRLDYVVTESCTVTCTGQFSNEG